MQYGYREQAEGDFVHPGERVTTAVAAARQEQPFRLAWVEQAEEPVAVWAAHPLFLSRLRPPVDIG